MSGCVCLEASGNWSSSVQLQTDACAVSSAVYKHKNIQLNIRLDSLPAVVKHVACFKGTSQLIQGSEEMKEWMDVISSVTTGTSSNPLEQCHIYGINNVCVCVRMSFCLSCFYSP